MNNKLKQEIDHLSAHPEKKGLPLTEKKSSISKKSVFTSSTSSAKPTEAYVQEHIHKNVEYTRRSAASFQSLPACMQLAFSSIEANFIIPEEFENSRKFGPLSGVSFEKRLIFVYLGGLLAINGEEGDETIICVCCGRLGHVKKECTEWL